MKAEGFVSIVIPCYNAQKYIEETVDSVINQSYKNFELILVNDGSTDESLNFLQKYTQDKRVRILDQENQGVNHARNNGYELTRKGEYLCFLDADDVWELNRLEKTVAYLNENPDIGLVHNDIRVIDQESVPTGQFQNGKEGWLLDDLLLWNGCCIPAPSSATFRREVMSKSGLFDPMYANASDQEFFFRVAKHFKIGRIAEPLTRYRRHEENMHMNMKRMEFDHIHAYKKSAKGGLFKSFFFKMRCFSNMYMILGFNFWGHSKNKSKGIYYMLLSLLHNPFNIYKPLSKVFKIN